MVITIIGVVILAIFYSIQLLKQCAYKGTETKIATEYKTAEPFMLSEYLDRTIQQQETMQSEKENQEPYVIILWWNNDGLRLNDDGSFEWISKNKEEAQYEYYTEYVQDILGNSHPIQRRRPVSVSYQPQQTINKEIYELEEKIRNYPKENGTYPDEYWKMIALLSNLYKIQSLQSDL